MPPQLKKDENRTPERGIGGEFSAPETLTGPAAEQVFARRASASRREAARRASATCRLGLLMTRSCLRSVGLCDGLQSNGAHQFGGQIESHVLFLDFHFFEVAKPALAQQLDDLFHQVFGSRGTRGHLPPCLPLPTKSPGLRSNRPPGTPGRQCVHKLRSNDANSSCSAIPPPAASGIEGSPLSHSKLTVFRGVIANILRGQVPESSGIFLVDAPRCLGFHPN